MSQPETLDDDQPISAADAARLLAGFTNQPALLLAVSGGPDSMALMWLAARWRKARAKGPGLIAVTVDHGLRPEAAREARMVKEAARRLDLPHRTLRWRGDKPKTGLPEAARTARYRLLAQAAKTAGASHVLTAHTRDDQAETLLMRLLRGSGITGLAAMAALSEREGLFLARPLLDMPKARLIATLKAAKIDFADDPTNRDAALTRPRLRALMPALAAEGGDARNLARLAARLARANAAIEVLADGAERYLALVGQAAAAAASPLGLAFDARVFAGLPDEIRLRLLMRAINRFGTEGPVELGKAEALLASVDQSLDRTFAGVSGDDEAAQGALKQARLKQGALKQSRLKRTLAGALVSAGNGEIRVTPAPARRTRRE